MGDALIDRVWEICIESNEGGSSRMTLDEHLIKECREWCLRCQAVCSQTLIHCLRREGEGRPPTHGMEILIACDDLCGVTAGFLLRGSDFYVNLCALCAELCLRCAENCDLWAPDERVHECAIVCRACAAHCRAIAG
jgi:hypothetical protein